MDFRIQGPWIRVNSYEVRNMSHCCTVLYIQYRFKVQIIRHSPVFTLIKILKCIPCYFSPVVVCVQVIGQELYQNIGISLVCVLATTLLFMASFTGCALVFLCVILTLVSTADFILTLVSRCYPPPGEYCRCYPYPGELMLSLPC